MNKDLHNELNEISPLLSKMKEKEEGYTVPNHFFNNMRIDIMNQVRAEMPAVETPLKQPVSWWKKLSIVASEWLRAEVAVGFTSVLLIGFSIFYFSKNDNLKNQNDVVKNPTIETPTANEQNKEQKNQNVTISEQPKETAEKPLKEKIADPIQQTQIILQKQDIAIAPTLKLEEASDEELNALWQEIIDNEELSEDEELTEEILN